MAEANLGTATVRTRLDPSGLQTGLAGATASVTTFSQRTTQAFQSLGRNGLTVFQGVATSVTAAAGALLTAANQAAKYADEVDKAALRTRLTRDTVQELRFVTDQLGGSFATIETGVRGLTQRLATNEDAFTSVGIATRAAGGAFRSTDEILFDTISTLQGVENETQRAVLAQELFGRSAGELGPLLAAGAGTIDEYRQKARDLGLVLDREAVASLVAYKDQLAAVQAQQGAITRELALSFLPLLTDSLLPAVQSAVTLFRGLPEPIQRATGALAGFGTAIGAAVAALRLLGISTAFLFGPAGIIIAGAGVVLTLAAAFAGQNRSAGPSLETALERANEAAGNVTGYESLDGALGTLADSLTGRVKTAFEVGREQIRLTLEEAEDAAAQFGRIAGALTLAQRATSGGPIRNALESAVFTDGRGSALTALLTAITAGDAAEADRIIELASFGLDERSLAVLEGFRSDLAAVFASTPAPRPAGTGGGGAGGGAGGGTVRPGATPRTIDDLLNDLARQGTALNRLASLGQITQLEASEGRFRLIDQAIRQVAVEFPEQLAEFYGGLRERQEAAGAEVARLTLDAERQVAPASDIAAARALDAPLTAAQRTLELELGRLINTDDLEALLNPKVERANSDIVGISEGIDLGPLGSSARREADRLALLINQGEDVLSAALSPTLARDVDFAARVAASSGARFIGDPSLARDATARFDEAGTALRNLGARSEVLTDTVQALVAAGAPAEEVQQAFRALLDVTGVLPDELVETYLALQGLLAVAAQGGDAIRRSGAIISGALAPSPFRDGRPGEQRGADEKGATLGAVPITFDPAGLTQTTNEGVRDALTRISETQQQAADRFANTVTESAFTFANGIVDSIRSGDIGQAFRSVLSGASSIVGAGSFGNLSLLGGSIPIAGLLSGAIGLIGNIVGGFLPGANARRQDAARASGANVRGAPAINLNFTFNQSLALASLTDPASRAALASQATDAFQRIENILTNVVMPRIERLEAGA